MRKCLIDADVLRYEVASVGEKLDKETGELDIRGWDFIQSVFDERIKTITEGAGGDNEPVLFLTGDMATARVHTRRYPEVQGSYQPNFREALATGKVYKGTRKQVKPFHWINLTAYILSLPNTRVAYGIEADDLIGIEHTLNRETTIICTRDKDLRQIPGWHYGWECGKQPELGPIEYDTIGKIELVRGKSGTKITGGGFAFFCAQLLTGDVVDNIGGAKNIGPVKANAILDGCTTEQELFDAVRRTYAELDSERWKELLTEQCHLLWIVRELNEDGSPKLFEVDKWLSM